MKKQTNKSFPKVNNSTIKDVSDNEEEEISNNELYVLYSELVHSLHFSPLYLSPLIMVISTGLKNLYAFFYRKYINHIYLLHCLLLPSASH
jgi:hypothetical protein